MKGHGLKLSAIGRGTIPEEDRQVSSPRPSRVSMMHRSFAPVCMQVGFDQNVQTRFIPVAHPNIIQARGVIGCGCLSAANLGRRGGSSSPVSR